MTGSQAGKVAIGTGGTANMGLLFATALAEDGANIVVHYNSSKRRDEADAAVADLEKLGVQAISYQADLTDVADITALADATMERFGTWDILVNTSGIIVRKPLAETTEDEFDRSFAINTKIPFFFMKEAYDRIADHGRIINLVTTQVAVTAPTYSAYAGSKAPVEHFTKAFSKEIGHRGVTVNCVAPGAAENQFPLRSRNRGHPQVARGANDQRATR